MELFLVYSVVNKRIKIISEMAISYSLHSHLEITVVSVFIAEHLVLVLVPDYYFQ